MPIGGFQRTLSPPRVRANRSTHSSLFLSRGLRPLESFVNLKNRYNCPTESLICYKVTAQLGFAFFFGMMECTPEARLSRDMIVHHIPCVHLSHWLCTKPQGRTACILHESVCRRSDRRLATPGQRLWSSFFTLEQCAAHVGRKMPPSYVVLAEPMNVT
jgi:hypothetical protein